MEEIWKDIDGYRESYQVSNLGRIRNKITGQMLRASTISKGYKGVRLYYDVQKAHSLKVHRIVANAFIPNPMNLPQINHIDGDKSNNRVDNLEWCSNDFNMHHANENGLILQGEDRPASKCSNESLKLIQRLIDCGFRAYQLAKIYGIAKRNMYHILRGDNYSKLNLNIKYPAYNDQEHAWVKRDMPIDLYNSLNDSLKDNTVLNKLIDLGYIGLQCNA